MGLSDFHPRPARVLADRQLRELSPTHGDGSPVLTRESLARMSTPLPRRLGPVLLLLASRTNGGLRPFIAGSALTLAVSRPARAFTHVSTCVLALFPFGTFYTRGFDPACYQPEPLRLLPVGATVTGWDIFLPRDSRALFTAHDKVELKVDWFSDFLAKTPQALRETVSRRADCLFGGPAQRRRSMLFSELTFGNRYSPLGSSRTL